MITSLTPAQEAQLEVYKNKWIEIGLDRGPCDFDKAKQYVKMAYEAAGEKCPDAFYLADSPMAAINLELELRGIKESDDGYHEARKQAPDNQIFGSHEAPWLSYYDYMWNVLDIQSCKPLEGLMELSKVCGWWAPFDTCVILQHRHEELHLDQEGRLHREDGPAIRYRDGYSVWAINGLRVTEQIVMRPETLTVDQIHGEQNLEIQAIMVERLGWDKYIAMSGAKLLDRKSNEVEGTKEALYQTQIGGKRLVATCTTGRIFTMGPIPDEARTCEEAQFLLGGRKKLNVIGRT